MRAICGIRRFHSRLLFLVALACLPVFPSNAAETHADSVEFPAWSRQWVGTLGTKQVEVSLNRVANGLSGSYCYQPCSVMTRHQLMLSGRMTGDKAELTERDRDNGTDSTGTWQIGSLKGGISGRWISPNGKRTLPLVLQPVQPEFADRFPYEIRLVADAMPEEEGDGCPAPPQVSAIRLYKGGELFQTLETESQGTCSVFTPRLIDANFDGWPDLTIAQFLPAGPDIPYQTWLYDKAGNHFIDAPPILQDISSPEFDPVHRIVYTFWRASCCEHGVSTYRWQGSDVEEIESQSSYFLPIIDGSEKRLCYITPSYSNGHIEFPSRVEQSGDGQLKLRQIDPGTCDIEEVLFLERTYIELWKPSLPGQKPTLVQTEEVAWEPTQTPAGQRFCPEVPFFDKGRIRRIVLKDKPDLCSDADPHAQ